MRGTLGPHEQQDSAKRAGGHRVREKFSIGQYGRDLNKPAKGLLQRWRNRVSAPLKPLYLSSQTRIALLAVDSEETKRLVELLATAGQCKVEHAQRLADFKRPLRHYHYCLFGSAASAADVGTCAQALAVDKLTQQLLSSLAADEFLIWPSPRGVLRFRLYGSDGGPIGKPP